MRTVTLGFKNLQKNYEHYKLEIVKYRLLLLNAINNIHEEPDII